MTYMLYVRLRVQKQTPVNSDPCVNISSMIDRLLISSFPLPHRPHCLEILKDLLTHPELLALKPTLLAFLCVTSAPGPESLGFHVFSEWC